MEANLEQNHKNAKLEISAEIRDKAYNICRNFLSGEWRNISNSDMIIKVVSGGLNNRLYYCSLPPTHTPLNREPSQVLLRMYGQLFDKSDPKISDTAIMILLSQLKFGPKLYGIFPGGRLEEYIPSRAMTCDDLKNPIYSAVIARKMAFVHSLDMPISKGSSWLFDNMKRWLKYIRNDIIIDELPESKKILANDLLTFDFESELTWLETYLHKFQSPIVFTHNDLLHGNILLRNDASTMHSMDDRIVFIDFEICSYNYRGFDIANHFCEWMFNYTNPQWPHHYHAYMDAYPNDAAKRLFIKEYLKQSTKYEQTEVNKMITSEEQLLIEVDSFALASHMFWILFCFHFGHKSEHEFEFWHIIKTRLTAYLNHKKQLLVNVIDQNCLNVLSK